jgi:hypothetical protein
MLYTIYQLSLRKYRISFYYYKRYALWIHHMPVFRTKALGNDRICEIKNECIENDDMLK